METPMKSMYITYQDRYSGMKISGNKAVTTDFINKNGHMKRAFYITVQLEAPLWGSVQSYDGAGMSGGPLHFTAVLPRTMQQGPLFQLLRRIEMVPGAPVKPLWDALAAEGWYVAKDGMLRDKKSGAVISGKAIRNVFTPQDGKVPHTGTDRVKAEKWATLFSDLLSDPKTFAAQADHSIEYLILGSEEVEMKAYRLFIPKLQSPERIGIEPGVVLPDPVDLAMCVYHAFTPNAPAIAKQCLEATLDKVGPKPFPLYFAQTLIKTLGTKKYGRWADIQGTKGSRYDATRTAVMASGLWSQTVPNLINLMPVDF
jgi:hypothetical protein